MLKNMFKGQTAIVTGAGEGIGFEIARQLAERGANIVLNDIDEEKTKRAIEKISKEGGRLIPLAGDAGDLSVIQAMVRAAVENFGELHIVMANAGVTTFGDFFDYKPEQFQQLLHVNLQGAFFLTQAAARQMRKQGKGGSVLLTSSVTGRRSHQYLVAYGMTKAAIEMLAKGLVAELAPHGIRVNAVAPGATITERTLLEHPQYAELWSKLTPDGRAAMPADIAQAALFLVSPQAGHINGQTLVVDGGWTLVSQGPDLDLEQIGKSK